MREDLAKISQAIEGCLAAMAGVLVALEEHDVAIDKVVPRRRNKPLERHGNYKDWDEFFRDILIHDPHIAMVIWISLETGMGFDYPINCLVSDCEFVTGGYRRLTITLTRGKRVSFILSAPLSDKLAHFMGQFRIAAKPSDFLFLDKTGKQLLRNASYNTINKLFNSKRFDCLKPTSHVRNLYAIKYGITHK